MKTRVCSSFPAVIIVILCLVFVGQVRAGTYEEEVEADHPLLWFRFQDADMSDGSSVADRGSVGRGGTYHGDSIYPVPGPCRTADQAAHLDQAAGSGDLVDIWDGPESFSYGDITVEMWARVQPEDFSNYSRLFQANGDWLRMEAPGVTMNKPYEYAVIGGDVTNYGFTGPTEDGEWHHIVVTYDSTGSGVLKELFIDGYSIGTANGPNDLSYDSYDRWTIGCEGNVWWQGNCLKGDIDEFAIYEGVLSDARILAHYVPEPATFLLLGVGGWALIRRRKV